MSDTIITFHAAERFVQRHAPGMTIHEGKTYLQDNIHLAAPLKEKTIKGDQQWQLDDPYCILVMKKDWHSKLWVCVTVLPQPQGFPIPLDELEMMREHILDQALQATAAPETINQIERVLSAEPQVDLIRPSKHQDSEIQRIAQEKKLWNRALSLLDSHNKFIRDTARQEVHLKADNENLVKALRLVLNALVDGLAEGDSLDLLQKVHEIDPALTTDAFLQPQDYTKHERSKIIQSARGDQKSVVDLA
jgi:hypothetical protein